MGDQIITIMLPSLDEVGELYFSELRVLVNQMEGTAAVIFQDEGAEEEDDEGDEEHPKKEAADTATEQHETTRSEAIDEQPTGKYNKREEKSQVREEL